MPDKYTKEAGTALCSIWIPIGSIVDGVRNGRECDVYIEGNNRAVRLSRVVVANLLEEIDELKNKHKEKCKFYDSLRRDFGNVLDELKKRGEK